MALSLGCSRELAVKLGAIEAVNAAHFRAMRESGEFVLCRDPETLQVVFWPLIASYRPPRESGP